MTTATGSSDRYTFSRKDYLTLFLITIWPQQTWSLYMSFRDVGWVAVRTNYGDAFGLVSYALLFALFEGVILFLVALVIRPFLPKIWPVKKQIVLLAMIVFILSFWAMISQSYALAGYRIPNFYATLMVSSGHPLWVLYGTALAGTVVSAALPLYLILRSPRAVRWTAIAIDRLTMLSVFYLFLDAIGLVTVVARNIPI